MERKVGLAVFAVGETRNKNLAACGGILFIGLVLIIILTGNVTSLTTLLLSVLSQKSCNSLQSTFPWILALIGHLWRFSPSSGFLATAILLERFDDDWLHWYGHYRYASAIDQGITESTFWNEIIWCELWWEKLRFLFDQALLFREVVGTWNMYDMPEKPSKRGKNEISIFEENGMINVFDVHYSYRFG